jgi:hypothetical protein
MAQERCTNLNNSMSAGAQNDTTAKDKIPTDAHCNQDQEAKYPSLKLSIETEEKIYLSKSNRLRLTNNYMEQKRTKRRTTHVAHAAKETGAER